MDEIIENSVPSEVRDRIARGFGRQGLMVHLGASLGYIGSGLAHILLPSRPEVTQQHGYFHAGAISAIAGTAGGCAAFTLFQEDASVLTLEYKINLLSPAEGDHLEAVGTVLKAGRTLTVCRVEVFAIQSAWRKLVAAGQQTLIRVEA